MHIKSAGIEFKDFKVSTQDSASLFFHIAQ